MSKYETSSFFSSDKFCSPISVGNKRDFAKPGIDTLQQGYVYASGERDRDRSDTASTSESHSQPPTPHLQQRSASQPQLPYSSVGISLRSGRHRVKDDSRANYADVVEVDHEAQVMVVGDVVRYFDRVRKNVNKAFMRQVLREALGPYCERKKSESAAAGVRGWGNSAVALEVVGVGDEGLEGGEGPGDVGLQEDVAVENALQLEPQQRELQQETDPEPREDFPTAGSINTDKELEGFFSDTTREEDDWCGTPQSPLYSPLSLARPPPEERRHVEDKRHEDRRLEEKRYEERRNDDRRRHERPSSDETRSEEKDRRRYERTHDESSREERHGRSSDERRAARAASRARGTATENVMAVRPGMDRAGLSSLRSLRQGLPGNNSSDDHDDAQSLRSLAMVGRTDSFSSRKSRK